MGDYPPFIPRQSADHNAKHLPDRYEIDAKRIEVHARHGEWQVIERILYRLREFHEGGPKPRPTNPRYLLPDDTPVDHLMLAESTKHRCWILGIRNLGQLSQAAIDAEFAEKPGRQLTEADLVEVKEVLADLAR